MDAPTASGDGVVVGRIIRGHGLDGALRIQSYSDNPERFEAGGSLSLAGETRTIASYHSLRNGYALLRLEGIDDAHAARKLAGQWLLAPSDPTPELPDGEYYHYQLVGLAVVTDQGERLGQVAEVLATGSNDVYVVATPAGGELLLPAISQVVKGIDLSAGQMLVHLIDGLR